MKTTVIVKVTATEFETADGKVVPHPVPFDEGKTPTVEDFQGWYDRWREVFVQQGLIEVSSGD